MTQRNYNKTKTIIISILFAFCSLLPLQAKCATATTTFSVTATVQALCTVTANPMTFGTYLGVALPITNTIGVTCTNLTPYTVGLDAGTGTGATVAVRKMSNSANTLNYSIYRDSPHTQVWGITAGTDTVAGTGNGALQNITAFGLIPAGQLPAALAYTDTIGVTVTY